ncbi:MAG TPA: hypothetical protein DER26_03885 [Verrucomicrobia bacterium]|nr:hypothetical protein [Verrucomicrobiota bacterium]
MEAERFRSAPQGFPLPRPRRSRGETAGSHSRSMPADCLTFVSSVKKPRRVRRDPPFGNESALEDCEKAGVRHLFKVRRSTRAFLPELASASQLSAEERRPRLIAHTHSVRTARYGGFPRPISAVRRHLRSPEAEIQRHADISVRQSRLAVERLKSALKPLFQC